MHLLSGDELSLEWSRRDNFDPFYGGPNKNKDSVLVEYITLDPSS